MKFTLVLLFALATVALGRPDNVINFEVESDDGDHAREQNGQPGSAVTGEYRWESPEGGEYYVKYIADADGYRIIESNAVPITADGVAADGNQGAFGSYEE